MMPECRSEILDGVQTMCRLYPSYRLCQMVANTASVAAGTVHFVLGSISDRDFLEAMRDSIRQRNERLGGESVQGDEGDTLPALLQEVIQGLQQLSEQYPDKAFVLLVLQVAEWAKEFSPFEFWDVEDADFLRAMQAHLAPTAVTP